MKFISSFGKTIDYFDQFFQSTFIVRKWFFFSFERVYKSLAKMNV